MAEIARLFPERDDEEDAVQSEALIEAMRIAEALIFAASDAVDEADIAKRIPEGVAVRDALEKLREDYSARGINLVRVNRKWTFRTAPDLGWLLSREQTEQRKLSRAAIETLAICAYHQPVTRAEIEDIRGVAISKGTLDVLLETGWVRLRGRRKVVGRCCRGRRRDHGPGRDCRGGGRGLRRGQRRCRRGRCRVRQAGCWRGRGRRP